MTKPESDEKWLEDLFAETPAARSTPGVKKAAVDDYEAPRSPLIPFWQRRDLRKEPAGEIDIAALEVEMPELFELLDEVFADMKKRRVEETAAASRIVENMAGPYPEGPIWFLDWSKFAPEEILRFWLGKIAHLSKYTDIHTRVPGALTRCEITMLLLMRGVEHDELKAMGLTPNLAQRSVRLIKEAVMRGELPRERVPHHVWNAKSVASVKVARMRKDKDKRSGSRWLNADGGYHDARDDTGEFEEEGDEDHDA